MGTPLDRLNEIPQRLKKFITHDVRKNRILALYLVIGAMVVGYGIYFIAVMYKDLTRPEEKPPPPTPKVSQVNRTPEKNVVAEKKAVAPQPEKRSTEPQPTEEEPEPKKIAEKARPAPEQELDSSKWEKYQLPRGPQFSVPPNWTVHEFSGEMPIVSGVRLQAPDSNISLKCYSRIREAASDYPKILKETMKKGGYADIKEQSKKINQQRIVQISGTLADKIMVVNIFEDQSDTYFIARLIASKKEYDKVAPYYRKIVESYEVGPGSAPVVSIEKLEQQLEESIEKKQDYLVGSTVWIKMKNGAKHTGVVIAEDDNSLTLESFRFGGRYSFTVKKKDIVQIER